MRCGALLLVAGLTSCHLADTPEGPTCEAYQHLDMGHCEADLVQGPVITITAAGGAPSCAPTPTSITVAPNGSFQFQNEDSVDHTIVGADGMAWVTVKAKQLSVAVGITKVGSWKFTISGCDTPGVVVVQ